MEHSEAEGQPGEQEPTGGAPTAPTPPPAPPSTSAVPLGPANGEPTAEVRPPPTEPVPPVPPAGVSGYQPAWGPAPPPPPPPVDPRSPYQPPAGPPSSSVVPVWGPVGPSPATEDPRPGGKRSPGWLWAIVSVAAALVGALIGGGIVAATNHDAGSTTVKEISAGPALLNGTTNIESVIAKVLPAVVSIDAKSPAPASQGLFGGGSGGGVQEDQGTGMIITSNGEVITNNHVISGATTMTVTLYGKTTAMPATLIDTDPTNDIALLQINGASNLPTVTYGNSDNVQVGDAVVAIGNALGLSAGIPTVTQGIISATWPDGAGQRPAGNGHRDPDQHVPDRRGHQPGQLGWAAGRQLGQGHRHEHGGGGELGRFVPGPEHRVRHPLQQDQQTPPVAAGQVDQASDRHRHRRSSACRSRPSPPSFAVSTTSSPARERW